MKRGEELGKAIAEAVEMVIDGEEFRTKADVARALGIEPPSLHNWMRTGRVSRDRKDQIIRVFSGVTTPQHWGLEDWPDEVYREPDAHVFVDIAVETRLPVSIAQQVLELINKYAVER